jgi:hypothetical protein
MLGIREFSEKFTTRIEPTVATVTIRRVRNSCVLKLNLTVFELPLSSHIQKAISATTLAIIKETLASAIPPSRMVERSVNIPLRNWLKIKDTITRNPVPSFRIVLSQTAMPKPGKNEANKTAEMPLQYERGGISCHGTKRVSESGAIASEIRHELQTRPTKAAITLTSQTWIPYFLVDLPHTIASRAINRSIKTVNAVGGAPMSAANTSRTGMAKDRNPRIQMGLQSCGIETTVQPPFFGHSSAVLLSVCAPLQASTSSFREEWCWAFFRSYSASK